MVAARCLVLLALAFPVWAAAQDPGAFFPHGVGDRWVYEVEGVTARYGSPADTVDATVEWRVLEVQSSAEADTLVL